MSFKTIQWVDIIRLYLGWLFILQTFAMPPEPQMQFTLRTQYTGKSVLVHEPGPQILAIGTILGE